MFFDYFSALITWKAPNKEFIANSLFIMASEKTRVFKSNLIF